MELPIALGQIVANKYRVDRLIGAGGMGVVAAAFHLELEQPVAIKFLNAETGLRGDGLERFRREARAVAKIHSQHVARVLDVGLLGEQVPFMVMELLEGHDLGQELTEKGPLPLQVAADYLLQAIDAIAEAHVAGIVHRDLKPSNLFLAQAADGTRRIKVLDFGISKIIGPTRMSDVALTRTASMIGSPLYMAPEQMRSARDVDERADIWSLGTILYELVSGEMPFFAESFPQLCVAVLNDVPRPVREFLPAAPDALVLVLSHCLTKELTERYGSVADLAEALVPFSPGSHAYAERARRLLSSPAARASLTPNAYISSAPPAAAFQGELPAAAQVTDRTGAASGGTETAWGETERGTRSKKRVPIIVGLLLALGAGAVALWPSQAPTPNVVNAPGASKPPSLDAELAPASPSALALPAANAENENQVSAAPSSALEIEAEPASKQVPTSAPAAPLPPRASAPKAQKRTAAPAISGDRAPAQLSNKPPSKPSDASSGITDFGGRYY